MVMAYLARFCAQAELAVWSVGGYFIVICFSEASRRASWCVDARSFNEHSLERTRI